NGRIWNPNPFHHLQGFGARLRSTEAAMQPERLDNLSSRGMHRTEGAERFLRDKCHAISADAADRLSIIGHVADHVLSDLVLEGDRSRGHPAWGPDQAED